MDGFVCEVVGHGHHMTQSLNAEVFSTHDTHTRQQVHHRYGVLLDTGTCDSVVCIFLAKDTLQFFMKRVTSHFPIFPFQCTYTNASSIDCFSLGPPQKKSKEKVNTAAMMPSRTNALYPVRIHENTARRGEKKKKNFLYCDSVKLVIQTQTIGPCVL